MERQFFQDRPVTYSVKEIYLTVQGEGGQAGRAAVFLRFAGCNLWTGREEHRARDAARNAAISACADGSCPPIG